MEKAVKKGKQTMSLTSGKEHAQAIVIAMAINKSEVKKKL